MIIKQEEQYPVKRVQLSQKGIFIGGLLGAAGALLFAPKPGRELRGDLLRKWVSLLIVPKKLQLL